MLPYAKNRHYDHHTASHAGVTDVTTPTGRGLYRPPNKITWHLSLKSIFNMTCCRFQKVNIATRPIDKTVEVIRWLGSDSRTYLRQHPPPLHCRGILSHLMQPDIIERSRKNDRLTLASQHPPPTKRQATVSRVRWKLNRQYPPPLQKGGESSPGLIKTKDPPPKRMDYSLLYGGLTGHLMRPDITEHSCWGDKLDLASQHPPPTKGQITLSRDRWKFIWEIPPPITRGMVRNLIATVSSLRSISPRLRAMRVTVQGSVTFFLIEAGTAPYYPKLLYPQRAYVKLKQLHSPLSFILRALVVTIKAVINRSLYSRNTFAYVTGLDNDSMLTTPTNQNRQILPSYTEFNDHICLVGNNYLVNEACPRKRYSP